MRRYSLVCFALILGTDQFEQYPQLEKLEEAQITLLKQRLDVVVDRRRADDEDESQEPKSVTGSVDQGPTSLQEKAATTESV